MPIKLRTETLDKVRPEIVKFIRLARVRHGSVLDVLPAFEVLWDAERQLPQQGPIRETLTRYIGEQSLALFISEELRELVRHRSYAADKDESVLDAMNLHEAEPLADQLLGALQSLPWCYWATLRLPPQLTEFVRRLPQVQQFGPNIRFIHDTEELRRISPLAPKDEIGRSRMRYSGAASLLGVFDDWTEDQAALQLRVEGFVPRSGGAGETVAEVHGAIKSFFGLAVALELVTPAGFPTSQPARLNLNFHRADESQGAFEAKHTLSHAETSAIAGLDLNMSIIQADPFFGGAQGRMASMATILSVPDQHQLLLRACRWLFDSYVGDDPLLSYVQATVVLEILLGDKASSDEIGLGTLLANRCAYMIGGSTSERARILKDFKAIYGVRSQIVHSGKHRLSTAERMQLRRLRWLGHRVIREEAKLAIEEINREKT